LSEWSQNETDEPCDAIRGLSVPAVEPAIRPPGEAESFLLQITEGCSSNSCTFCGAYAGKKFRMKDVREIASDIDAGARERPGVRRVFLMDGDALAVGNAKLIPILMKINQKFRALTRIASYANGYNITSRSDGELDELARENLKLIYVGLESGSQKLLDRCRKRSSVAGMIEAVGRAAMAGIKTHAIVLLGLGGRRHSEEHVRETVEALNLMQPKVLSFLTLMVIPGTPLFAELARGEFAELTPGELLREARGMIEGLELEKTVFRSDHASNYLPLEGRFPQDKKKILRILGAALSGELRIRPEALRGL